MVDWGGAKLYVPNAVQSTLLQGDWLEGHLQAGTIKVLAGTEELKCMRDKKMQYQISILKFPKFWRQTNAAMNLGANSSEGRVKYDVEWGYLYDKDCELCKKRNECKVNCKYRNFCKLYVMKIDKGVVKIKRINVNAKLPVRGTAGSAGYDLAAVQAAVVPAYGKCLVKTGLSMGLPPDYYGRVAPRSGLALNKFIDVGA